MTDKAEITQTLQAEWTTLTDYLAGLSPEDWSRPTCLPGWRVTDVVAHLIGTESMLAGDPTPSASVDVSALPHVRNDIAAFNEQWVQALRDEKPDAMLARFREITARRSEALTSMSQADFDAPSWTPAGQATYGRFMQIRTYDTWMHEQDIRTTLGTPGNETGPAASTSLDEASRAMGYVIGKRAAAPDGSTVLIDLTGPIHCRLTIKVDGRAHLIPEPDEPPTTTLHLPSSLFMRLCGGRPAPTTPITIEGDHPLAHRILANLAFTI